MKKIVKTKYTNKNDWLSFRNLKLIILKIVKIFVLNIIDIHQKWKSTLGEYLLQKNEINTFIF